MGGLAIKIFNVQRIQDVSTQTQVDFCFCGIDCVNDVETVFADVSDSDRVKNDYSTFLQRKIIDTDTIDFELYKDGVKVNQSLNDFGTLYTTFTNQPLYVGLRIEWRQVLSLLGVGVYQVKVQRNITGVYSSIESRRFRLIPYKESLVQHTIRIETLHNNNILNSEFDYTELLPGGWPQSYRVNGYVFEPERELTKNFYQDEGYYEQQNQTSIRLSYNVRIDSFADSIYKILTVESLLSTDIFITHYNIVSSFNLERLSVVINETGEIAANEGSRTKTLNASFLEKREGNLSRRN